MDLNRNGFKYTIERHLESFQENPDCKFICGSWNVEKPQYINRLKAVSQRYPYYSLHDCTHSEAILKAIEFLLGEDRIRLLSPTDTWLILQCAYTHDIGMALSAKEMVNKFNENYHFYKQKLEEKCKDSYDVLQAWEYVKQVFHENEAPNPNDVSAYLSDLWVENNSSKIKSIKLAKNNLNEKWYERSVRTTGYFALISQTLLRSEHAEQGVKFLSENLDEKTYNGLIQKWFRSLSFKISGLHTSSFKDVMALPYKINGLCGDYAHPRFVAVLLRLGDLLDLDSNRFNQAQLEVIGDPGYESFVHQIKHSAITEFCITPQKITINSQLKTSEVENWITSTYPLITEDRRDLSKKLCLRALKELRDWLSWLENETINLRVNWLEIVPENFVGSCPVLDKDNMFMKLDEKIVDEDTLNLHYEITSKRATEIIEGASLYENEKLVFIRELIQNSADATCRQLYRDWIENKEHDKILPWSKQKDKDKYRIDIYVKEHQTDDKNYLEISIRDHGIGISEDMLKKMKYIGNIVSVNLNKEADDMPPCIKPTGNFGVGMQSVFQVTDAFDVQTRTRNGSGSGDSLLRKMKFYSNRIDGSIISYDLSTNDKENREFGYGTNTIIRIHPSELDECIKPLMKTLDTPIDFLSDSLQIYSQAIKDYANKIYSNNLIPLYVNNELVANTAFGNEVINVQTLAGEVDSKRYIVYDKENSNRFSFYDEKIGVMISYSWPKKTIYDKKNEITLYYKDILVDDILLKNLITIPFFDTQIHLYMGTPENYLEINRDHFLAEKHNNIASRIRLTHINAMKALFSSDSQTSAIWKSDNTEQTEYRQAVKKYMSVIVRNYSKDVDYSDTEYLSFDDLYPNQSNCLSYYLKQPRYLRFVNNKQPGEISIMDKMLEKNKNIWFIDADKLYCQDTPLKQMPDYSGWHLLCHDHFVSYPEIAIRKAKTIVTTHNQAILIYQIGKRTGGTVEISENDYWHYAINKYNYYKNNGHLGNIRLVFPGTGKYEASEVYCLPSEINSKEALRFNRYFIAPMNISDLHCFINQYFDDIYEIELYLKNLVKQKGSEPNSNEDYWKQKQHLLIEHVQKYSAKQIHANPFGTIDINDICRCYVSWLWEFYKKYHEK